MNNMLKSPIEVLFKGDLAWTIWQDINRCHDCCAKRDKIAESGRMLKLYTRFTGVAKHRFQPEQSSNRNLL